MSRALLSSVQRLYRIGRRFVLVTVISTVAGFVGVPWYLAASTRDSRSSLVDAPSRRVAIVLGAAVWGQRPSHMLEDRLSAALELYRSGRCTKILVSGASNARGDELAVMRDWLENRGVPHDAIAVDYAGLRTLDSMVRAKRVFGLERALVVTQAFHLPRAVYLGRMTGLDVVGVVAPPKHPYSQSVMRHHRTRERLAQVRALLDVWVLQTQPRYLGPHVDV